MGAMPVLKPFYIPWQLRLAQGLRAPTSSQSIDRVHQVKSTGASPPDIHGVLTTLACRGGALSRELLPQEAAETDQKECGKDPHAPPGTGTGISSSLDHFVFPYVHVHKVLIYMNILYLYTDIYTPSSHI